MSNTEGITKLRRRGAVVIDNNTVYDSSISYSALGVLAVLMARPDDAPKGYRSLLRKDARVGQSAILAAFRELRAAGYRYQFLRTTSTRQGRAKVVTDTYISETPISLEEAKQWHFEATGLVAIDMPDRRTSKATLASPTGAQSTGAQSTGAQSPDAQTKAFLGSAQNREQDQSLGDPGENVAQAVQEDPVEPPLPAEGHRDDATPKQERGPGYEDYLAFKNATRATVGQPAAAKLGKKGSRSAPANIKAGAR